MSGSLRDGLLAVTVDSTAEEWQLDRRRAVPRRMGVHERRGQAAMFGAAGKHAHTHSIRTLLLIDRLAAVPAVGNLGVNTEQHQWFSRAGCRADSHACRVSRLSARIAAWIYGPLQALRTHCNGAWGERRRRGGRWAAREWRRVAVSEPRKFQLD